jgi:hypothetical protein
MINSHAQWSQAPIKQTATIFPTQLLNMGQDRAVSDSQTPTPKPNKISHIDIIDDCLGRQPANCKTVYISSIPVVASKLSSSCRMLKVHRFKSCRRPCFSLAVQIERSKSTPRCDISLLRNHVSAHAIHAHADWSLRHRSTTAEPSCAGCKQNARRATRMTIGRHCMRRPPHDLLS